MHRFSRLLVALALAGTALAAGTAAAAGSQSHATAHWDPACPSGSIVNWLNTSGSGAAGSIYYQIEFTNVSAHACSLYGYPGVSAVNASGHQIGVPAGRITGTEHVVNLAPNASARASWQVTETGDYSPSACQAQTARGLRVYAPGSTASDVIPFPYTTCSTSIASLHIAPVRPS